MSLYHLGLDDVFIDVLLEKGYTNPTPIQKVLIPKILEGHDIVAGAQTGTGKTAGFSLPILQKLFKTFKGTHYPKAVIVVPTRELAKQVYAFLNVYGKNLPLKSTVLYGGANLTSQANRLKDGIDIVVATSGRLLEHIYQKNIDLHAVEYLVLDEADTILDMGFVKEISKLIEHLPTKKQTILTSATLSGSVKILAQEILHHPKFIEVDKMGTSATNVEQIVYPVMAEKKLELLSYLIGSKNYQQVLVFVRKKELADEVARELNLWGLKTVVMHGDKSSGKRTKALESFKEKKTRILVATDITARGIDIPSLEVVINYDIPHVIGDYIHRIGRTGRAGKKGLAITLNAPLESVALRDVEKMLGKNLPKKRVEGYAPLVEIVQKGARKDKKEFKNTGGAFGKKKKVIPKNKKRKTTKRDGFKAYDASKIDDSYRNTKKKSTSNKK